MSTIRPFSPGMTACAGATSPSKAPAARAEIRAIRIAERVIESSSLEAFAPCWVARIFCHARSDVNPPICGAAASPETVRGSSSTGSIRFGTSVRGPGARARELERAPSGSSGARPAPATTKATTAWPHSRSSAPTTAASETDGCSRSAASTRSGRTFSPPLTIRSSRRPSTQRYAVPVEASVVAGVEPAVAGDRAGRDRRPADEDLGLRRSGPRCPVERPARGPGPLARLLRGERADLRAGLGQAVGLHDVGAAVEGLRRAARQAQARRRRAAHADARSGAPWSSSRSQLGGDERDDADALALEGLRRPGPSSKPGSWTTAGGSVDQLERIKDREAADVVEPACSRASGRRDRRRGCKCRRSRRSPRGDCHS